MTMKDCIWKINWSNWCKTRLLNAMLKYYRALIQNKIITKI